MDVKVSLIIGICVFAGVGASLAGAAGKLEIRYNGAKASPRIRYATDQVQRACDEVSVSGALHVSIQGKDGSARLKPEGFHLKSLGDGAVAVVGADQSGVLYGCLELVKRIRAAKGIPKKLDLTDAPEFKLRGPCIGMQKLTGGYLWPYTPKNFPFFYDKAHWREYLDFLVGIRMNSLYLWNGHPFASLVQLEDYPEALEVSPEVLKKNREMMYWLTGECDKRGIWLIQMFYNIHLPKGLGIGTSLGRSQPKAADYTRKSIAKFVQEYPSVGLLVCLGEALSGRKEQVQWFTETIIPGMIDGLKVRGWSNADLMDADKLPPIVVRGHHIVEYGSHEDVLSKGKKLYPNLFSMVKYNGESLTSETPRGKYQQYHKDMARYSGTHMANVHLLSNLEPFRYADFSFIWNSCKAIRDRLDGKGLHLYPLAYWDWPNTPDKADITQLERDRLWFEIWARYCWKLDRDPAKEREFWIGRLTETYGDRTAAEGIYEAYDASGECAPRILRRFGITGGNRQCLELGMFLWQLTDPKKARVWQELYDSDSPPGETITQYIHNEYADKPHVGETPPQIVKEVLAFAARAVKQIEAAAPHVTKNKEEFERLRNDMHCIEAMSKSYCAKVNAAMMVHRYRNSKDPAYMEKALPLLEESLEHYRTLAALTKDTYRYSNAFHGRQRIPKGGVYHCTQMVGDYEKELADFRNKVAALEKGPVAQEGWRANRANIKPYPAAKFQLLTKGVETYEIKKGAKVFTDRDYAITEIAPQLVGLTGIRFSHGKARKGDIIQIEFEVAEAVKVLVGYFDAQAKEWLQVPMLEHVAHANDRGGIDPVLEDAADIVGAKLALPKVNVHAFKYDKGRHTLEMIGKGSYIILGVLAIDKAPSERQAYRLNQFVLDTIKAIRIKGTQPQPPQVEEFNKKYTEYCRQRAEAEYKKHGRWFYCEDHKEFGGQLRWDEVVTYRVYWQLCASYGSLEKIPNYTKENHRKAIAFWQSWQKEDGSFRNLFTGKGNGNDSNCNGKYIPGILKLIGCKPLYKTSGYGAAKMDVEQCLRQIASGKMNHGMATASVMLQRIHEGQAECVPVLERAIELALSQLSRHTGMFHGPKGNPSGGTWSGYGTTAETMKGLLRMIGYMGVENLPYRHVRADRLIENQKQFRKGGVSVKRNTAEMVVQCLLESPYRSDELLKVLDGHSKVIMEGQPWNNHMTGDYTAYILMMFGPYLNWEGYEGKAPRTPFTLGGAYDWRVELGPFGRCANVIRKRPEELLWHKDWSSDKYGLRARNTAHETRKVIDVVPASSDEWARSKDNDGRISLTRTFSLDQARLDNPYLKIRWRGADIEIFINGVFVRRKLGSLADYGAVHLPPDARKSLHPGENTIVVRSVAKDNSPDVSAGLIDWRLLKNTHD